MAYQDITTVNSKPTYQQIQVGVLGVGQKTVNYGTRYDPENGDYEVRAYKVVQNSVTGQKTIEWENDVLYQNGTWYRIATQDSFLFDQNTKGESIVATLIADQTKQAVEKAHKGAGGYAGGNVLHPTVKTQGQHSATDDKTYNPSTQPTIVLTGPAAAIANAGLGISFTSRNERELFGEEATKRGLLVYPLAILRKKQDYLKIIQYNYEAPYADALFPKSGTNGIRGAGEILTNGLQRENMRTKKNKVGTVILPIPEGIVDSNSATWGPDPMNNMSAAVMSQMMSNVALAGGGLALASIMDGLGGVNAMPAAVMISLLAKANAAGGLDNPAVQAQFRASIASAAAQKSGFDIPAESILSRGYGVIPNQNMELLFQNVALREFNFGFKLAPRSRKEASNVRRIIRFFKQGMSARISNPKVDPDAKLISAPVGSTSLFLGTPNVFHLEYIHGPTGEHIRGLNRFKTCALTNTAMTYADGGIYQSFDDGQPAHMNMALSFTELEPVYHSDYQGNLRTANEMTVNAEDIGF